ncbi:MAG: hypothetical protein LBJ87_02410 [bacterium]|jgi:hypothetical protein|nr:hypothetical protein [bacterium]
MTATGQPLTTNCGERGTLYVGTDDRGIELEVITVPRGADELVVHSMPTGDRYNPEVNR